MCFFFVECVSCFRWSLVLVESFWELYGSSVLGWGRSYLVLRRSFLCIGLVFFLMDLSVYFMWVVC